MFQFLLKIFLSILSLFGFGSAKGFEQELCINDVTIRIVKGDITHQNDVGAIVNAANERLLAGGGVCGAIFAKAGKSLTRECDKIIKNFKVRKVPVGSSVITSGGNLKQNIIHVVSPNFNPYNSMQKHVAFDANGKNLMAQSYTGVLQLAEKKGIAKVAIPFLSGGNFCRKFSDRNELTKIALDTVIDFCNKNAKNGILKEVRFVLYSDSDFNLFVNALN